MPTRLIVNGDDLGLAACVNRGILRAHRDGILTSASLLANAPATDEALAMLRDAPALGIGVHLNLVRGSPLSPPETVQPLLGAEGRFPGTTAAIRRRAKDPACREAAEREYRAQIERILNAGVRPTHLDAEKHHAVCPPLARLVAGLAEEYGIGVMRTWEEPVLHGLRHLPWPGWRALAQSAMLRTYATLNRRTDNLARPRFLLGQLHIGRMTSAVWLALASNLPQGDVEVMVHPAEADGHGLAEAERQMGTAWIDATRTDELNALLDPGVRAALDGAGAERITFAELRAG
jgi:predicted glycoside hydrolase/deacetylase ChbG (UPF0249 family)